MTRRAFIFAPLAAALAQVEPGVPDTPYNRLACSANRFQGRYKAWADRITATRGSFTVDTQAANNFQPLSGLWRKVEHYEREYIRS